MPTPLSSWAFYNPKYNDKHLQVVLRNTPFCSYLHSVNLDGSNVTSWGLNTLIRASQPWLKHCSMRWCPDLAIEPVNRLFKTLIDQQVPIALEKFEFWGSACAPVHALPLDHPVYRGLQDLLGTLKQKSIATDIVFCQVEECFAANTLPISVVNTMLLAYFLGLNSEESDPDVGKVAACADFQATNKCPGPDCSIDLPGLVMCLPCRRVRSCWKCDRQFCDTCVTNALGGCRRCGPLCDDCAMACPFCRRFICQSGHSVMLGRCECCGLMSCTDCRKYRYCGARGCEGMFCDGCTIELCSFKDCPNHDSVRCRDHFYGAKGGEEKPVCEDCCLRVLGDSLY